MVDECRFDLGRDSDTDLGCAVKEPRIAPYVRVARSLEGSPNFRSYETADLDTAHASLTVRNSSSGQKTAIPSEAVVGTTAQRSSSNRRTYAYISAGAAAVFIGGGLLFAERASKYDDELNARPHPQAASISACRRRSSVVAPGAGRFAAADFSTEPRAVHGDG